MALLPTRAPHLEPPVHSSERKAQFAPFTVPENPASSTARFFPAATSFSYHAVSGSGANSVFEDRTVNDMLNLISNMSDVERASFIKNLSDETLASIFPYGVPPAYLYVHLGLHLHHRLQLGIFAL